MLKKPIITFFLGLFFGCVPLAFQCKEIAKAPIVAQVLERKSYISAYDGRCKNPFYDEKRESHGL